MDIEIADLPMKHGDFPQLCQRLPEGMNYLINTYDIKSSYTFIPYIISTSISYIIYHMSNVNINIHLIITSWWYTYPSEKYARQLGWWHSQDMEQFQATDQYLSDDLLWISLNSLWTYSDYLSLVIWIYHINNLLLHICCLTKVRSN